MWRQRTISDHLRGNINCRACLLSLGGRRSCSEWDGNGWYSPEYLRALFSYAALYIKPAPTLLQLTREPSALSVGSACKEAATGIVFKPLLELHRIPEQWRRGASLWKGVNCWVERGESSFSDIPRTAVAALCARSHGRLTWRGRCPLWGIIWNRMIF